MASPRVVVVTRPTEYDDLIARHGTRGQVEFFLRTREQAVEPVVHRHELLRTARRVVAEAVPIDWRSTAVSRGELARFVFEPEDIVVALGQDGLVANVAKYLRDQPVIGVSPAGATPLMTHQPAAVGALLREVVAGRAAYQARAMVRVSTDDGQVLDALNEVYAGQPGHQSARYLLTDVDGGSERQSSSGVIVGTGTGATGWCASVGPVLAPGMPLPVAAEPALAWFVREAWPSATTGTGRVAGRLTSGQALVLRCESEELVAFGDGMETDRLLVGWGQRLSFGLSPRTLRTVV